MSVLDFYLLRGGKHVREEKLIDLYQAPNVPVFNFTDVSLGEDTSLSGGVLYISSFPESGINFHNRELGKIANYTISGMTLNYYTSAFNLNTRKFVSISGSFVASRG